MCIQRNSPGSQPEENMIGVSCLDTLLLRRYFLLFSLQNEWFNILISHVVDLIDTNHDFQDADYD